MKVLVLKDFKYKLDMSDFKKDSVRDINECDFDALLKNGLIEKWTNEEKSQENKDISIDRAENKKIDIEYKDKKIDINNIVNKKEDKAKEDLNKKGKKSSK